MSGLLYMKNWEEVKVCQTKWWKFQEPDSVLLAIGAPKENAKLKELQPPSRIEDRWTDADFLLECAINGMESSVYSGNNTFPYVTASLGPGSVGTFVGARPNFANDTVWYESCFDDIKKASIKYDENNRWWKWTLDTLRKLKEATEGKCVTAMPDLIENLDTLSAVLDPQKLLVYLMDEPKEVHRLQRELMDIWFIYFDAVYDVIKDETGGSAFMAFNVWAPGRMAKTQCDFSAMISPKMFDEFVIPYLEEQCNKLDYSLYHLDGPDAICHLNLLLKIKKLNAIQWQPGAGKPMADDETWHGILKRILDNGKSIQVGMPPEAVKGFVKKFGKRGLNIHTWTDSEKDALELFAESKKW